MKTTSILTIMALLIGLSFSFSVCNAQQKSNEESFFEEDESPVVNNVKNERTLSELEKVQKENADLKKLNNNLRDQADERAELENKLLQKDQENKKLKAIADANKADADKMAKDLLDAKMLLMQKEEAENSIKVDAPIAENFSVIQENPVDSAKKDSVKVKKVVTHTRVLATMAIGDTAFIPVKEKKLVPIQKKGTIVILEEGDPAESIARIRKSDVEKNKAKIEELIKLGYTLQEVNK